MSDSTETTPVVAEAQVEAPVATKSAEAWAEAKGTPDFILAATRTYFRWGIGRELSERDFDAAVEKVSGIKLNVR